MKAKQVKSLGKLLAFASALLALVAVIMVFLPQIAAASEDSDVTYNGLAIAFGKELAGADIFGFASASTVINFSFMNLLCYVLVLGGLVLEVLQLANIGKGKLISLIASVALIAGGILFFFALDFSTITSSGSFGGLSGSSEATSFASLNSESIKVWELGIGAIIGGITAILSGVCYLGKLVIEK